MKDHLRRLVEKAPNVLLRACIAREYLQARILQSFQDDGVFMHWAFLGGTALRFLYSLPRYSEDLDFSAIADDADCNLRSALSRARNALESEGYEVRVKLKEDKVVMSAFVKFPGLPYELGLSPRPSEVFSVKVEIDTNPPAGAVTATTLVRRHVVLNLVHHDKASLLAGKLHALLTRPWTKGRDVYDMIWYLSDRRWPSPNLALANTALLQTGWDGPELTAENWREVVGERFDAIHWDEARRDVQPFLERPEDSSLLSHDVAVSTLR